jgi:hypothetical protein
VGKMQSKSQGREKRSTQNTTHPTKGVGLRMDVF